jgi:hypothetical protein
VWGQLQISAVDGVEGCYGAGILDDDDIFALASQGGEGI